MMVREDTNHGKLTEAPVRVLTKRKRKFIACPHETEKKIYRMMVREDTNHGKLTEAPVRVFTKRKRKFRGWWFV